MSTNIITGLSIEQEPKYTTNGRAIINRASGEEIPGYEPVFILRARDRHALRALRAYLQFLQDNEHRKAVWHRIEDFLRFAQEHPGWMKEPDTEAPKEPV